MISIISSEDLAMPTASSLQKENWLIQSVYNIIEFAYVSAKLTRIK